MGTTKPVPCRTSLAASPRHLLMLSGLSGFNQIRHEELILVLKWLPLMFVAYLPYREIHLRHKRRLRLFIKHQQSNYISEQSCSCGSLGIQNKSGPGNCFFLILWQCTGTSVRVSRGQLLLLFLEATFKGFKPLSAAVHMVDVAPLM